MMHMTFYWGREVIILVNSWHTKSWLNYSLSLLVCVLASILYQYLETRRLRIKLAALKPSSPAAAAIGEPLLQSKGGGVGGKRWSVVRVGGAVLFGINSAIGYLLMLAVMSFNGGVFLAAVLGLGIGYFFFRSEDENWIRADNPCACA